MRRVGLAGFAVVVALATASCGEGPVMPTSADPSFAISDAVHGGGNEHFFWLPPMVRAPDVFNGAFDGALLPVVRICDLGDCGASLIAEFTTTTGPGSQTVRVVLEGEHYIVNWHTDEFAVAPGPTYRISVTAEDRELGFADIQLGSTGKEVKNLTTGEVIGLLDGRTLPIKFRIEEGIVGAVVVTPSSAVIGDGETQPFTASVTDLHGVPLAGAAVEWDISETNVATLAPLSGATDASGEHSTIATPGTSFGTPATIIANVGGVEGNAVLEVEEPSGGLFAYVTNWFDADVSVIDLTTNTSTRLPFFVGGAPEGIAITPDATRVYVSTAITVAVIDVATNTLVGTPISAGSQLRAIAITPDGTEAYVARQATEDIVVIDIVTNAVVGVPIAVGIDPNGIVITPDGSTAYVTNRSSNDVYVIDLATKSVSGPPIAVGSQPNGPAITPDGSTLYVPNRLGANVSVIDVATRTVVGVIAGVGIQPQEIAITPDGTRGYVVNLASDNVAVIDLATNMIAGSPIVVGDQPRHIAITPDGTRAYVTNGNDATVSVIDLATNTVVGSPIPVGQTPWAIAITPF